MAVKGNNGIRSFGTLSYGEPDGKLGTAGVYNFPPTYSLSFSAKPIMASNNVTTKYTHNELTVTWYLPYEALFWEYSQLEISRRNPDANTPTVDTAVQQIRAILMQPRKTLKCTYQGLGPDVGSSTDYGMVISPQNDVNFGPLPIDFKWRNIAAQQCVEMVWVVAFHTNSQIIFNNSNTQVATPNLFLDLSWSRTFDIDEIGAVTITTTGKYQARSNISYSDTLRYATAFPVPTYCQRVSQKFQNDPDGVTTTFTLVDKQFPFENALPPKCIKMDLTHEVSSSLLGGKLEAGGFNKWMNIFQGSITLPPGEPFITAYLMFWFYARQRLMRTAPGGIGETTAITMKEDGVAVGQKARTVITKISFKEALFDRTHNFRVEYLTVNDRDRLIQQTGIFTPLYNFADLNNEYQPWYEAGPLSKEPWSAGFNRTASGTPETNPNSLYSQWRRYRDQYGDSGTPEYWENKDRTPWSVFGYLGFNDQSPLDVQLYVPNDKKASETKITHPFFRVTVPPWGAEISETQYRSQTNPLSSIKLSPALDDHPFALDKERTYVSYDVQFSLTEQQNTIQYVRQKYDSRIYSNLTGNGGDTSGDFKIRTQWAMHNAPTGRYTGTSQNEVPLDADYTSTYSSQPTTILVLSGSAVRVGYPPTIPFAYSYKTPLMRAEQSTVNVKQIGQGQIPVYLATWSIPYYVNTSIHNDVLGQVKVKGLTGEFT